LGMRTYSDLLARYRRNMQPLSGVIHRTISRCIGARKWIVHCALIVWVISIAAGSRLSAEPVNPEKNILILCGFTAREAFAELEPFKRTVRTRVATPVNFYVEYLESQRFGDPGFRE